MGLRQFGPHILTLEKQANAVPAYEILRIAQELRQGRAGAGGHHIEGVGGPFFHPLVHDHDLQLHDFGSRCQKSAFLGGRIMQGHTDPVPQQFRQYQARKPSPGTQIRQSLGIFRNQGCQLRGIPEMPPPQIFQRLWGNQIVTGVPIEQEIGVPRQAPQRFT